MLRRYIILNLKMNNKLQELYNMGLSGKPCPSLYLPGCKGYKSWLAGYNIYLANNRSKSGM